MGDLKATQAGLRLRLKRLTGMLYRARARASWRWTAAESWAYQEAAFRRMYGFARARVPFYRDGEAYPPLPAEAGQGVLELLAGLPVLEKGDLREHNARFFPDPPLRLTSYHRTSGTTGTPIRLAATLWERGFQQALRDEWYRRICGTGHPRTLALSGFLSPSQEDRALSWTDRTTGNTHLSIYALGPENRGRVLELLDRVRPHVVTGYASAVHQLALLLRDRPESLRHTRAAVVTSEVLQPDWRARIEEAVCDRVYDFYSSQEGAHFVIECDHGAMHVQPQFGIVEIVDAAGRPCAAGETGRVLLTGLVRRSMPLIRYAVGDDAVSTGYATGCACGLGWPTIGAVMGRSEDLVRTRDGRQVGYLCFHATRSLDGIREAQLIQRDYERFTFRIVRAPEAPPAEQLERAIRAELARRLQTPVEVEFQYLDQIPRGARGKFRAVVVDFDSQTSPE
ncbi:MAG TPA: hypothetical protein VF006_31510 [Longimicrobium sp.]